MNEYQDLWWQQARSDHTDLLLLRRRSAAPCHQLHYLQMVTEKLSKAYFWRSGTPPSKSHARFVKFLRALGGCSSSERPKIASALGFGRFEGFQSWTYKIQPLAYALESLAPALAQDNGPNPEYPWPRTAPRFVPATFKFDVWEQLTESGRGRQLLQVIDLAVNRFSAYG
jgi:hypothetical protein